MLAREYTAADEFVVRLDRFIRILLDNPGQSQRPCPANGVADTPLTCSERHHSAALMRVNHAGEVSAQALYKAQALTARDAEVRRTMRRSAFEETDHLSWCKTRLAELGGHTSYLCPFWLTGSFAIGVAAGMIGDKWNLGFVVETEHLVIRHLENHLQQLPEQDLRSRAILAQMQEDEAHHATLALHAGAAGLPEPVRQIMRLTSRIMTTTAYWI